MTYDLLHLGILESDLSGPIAAVFAGDNDELQQPQEKVSSKEALAIGVAGLRQQRMGAVAQKNAQLVAPRVAPPQNSLPQKKLPQAKDADLTSFDWRQRAACRTADPELFFVPGDKFSPERAEPAKAICRKCTVADQCLQYALKIDDRFAILGATTPDERRKIAHKRGKV